jgi:hypothetical protein
MSRTISRVRGYTLRRLRTGIILSCSCVSFTKLIGRLPLRMNSERNKSLWPWIIALLIALPVVYVASFGPACWYAERCVEKTGNAPPPWLGLPYCPLGHLAVHGPAPIAVPLREYSAIFVPMNTYLYLPLAWRRWHISIAHP